MRTQTSIDLRTAREHAADLGVECTIEVNGAGDEWTIIMDTGEVEHAAGLPRVLAILSAYAVQS
jgi:hypothetical protein